MVNGFVLFNEQVFLLLERWQKTNWIAFNPVTGEKGLIRSCDCSPCFVPRVNMVF
jgi:hypothetical protein